MLYWRMNTDKKARDDVKTCDVWYKCGMAFAGDYTGKQWEHSTIFRKLSPGDGIFMHVSGVGLVGYGIVQEDWDTKAYAPQDSFLYNIGEPCEIYEYRIKVKWLPEYDRRTTPLNINGLMPYMGTYSCIEARKWDIRKALEKLRNKSVIPSQSPHDTYASDDEIIYEGAAREIVSKFYERNPTARGLCLAHWGASCSICGFNFDEYGDIGKGYIHVHHIVPISEYDEKHPVDPVKDLCPVCPNCHAMLHRKSPPYTPEELKEMLK